VGTRFYARGIDLDGNVANFVESELISESHNDKTGGIIQIRGSVPGFWNQDQVPRKINIDPEC